MTVTEIKETLAKGICTFKYTKKDGSERVAKGTRYMELISDYCAEPKGTGAERSGIVTYFDLEKEAWRSFNEDSFIEFL